MAKNLLENFPILKNNTTVYNISDNENKEVILVIYYDFNAVTDSHSVLGQLGCKSHLKVNPNAHCIFL